MLMADRLSENGRREAFERFRDAVVERQGDIFAELSTWAAVARDEIEAVLASQVASPTAVGRCLNDLGWLARHVHDLGRTDQRLAALDRATQRYDEERARWREYVTKAGGAP